MLLKLLVNGKASSPAPQLYIKYICKDICTDNVHISQKNAELSYIIHFYMLYAVLLPFCCKLFYVRTGHCSVLLSPCLSLLYLL